MMPKKRVKVAGLSRKHVRAIEAKLHKILPKQDADALKTFLLTTIGGGDTGLNIEAKRGVERLAAGSLNTAQAIVDPSRLFATGLFNQYNPSLLVTRKGLQIFDEMMFDEQVKMAMTFKTLACLAPGWQIQSPGDQEDDWEVTKFVRDNLTNFPEGFELVLKKIMRALRYGYSVCEKIYTTPQEAPPWAPGKATVRRINEIKPHYIDFDVNAFGEVLSVIQRWTPGTPSTIPEKIFSPEKFIHFAFDAEHENPYGRSDLEAAYRPWWIKDNAYKWLAIFLERYGLPPFFLFYNPDDFQDDQVEALKKIVRNIQNATMGLLPRTNKESLEFWTQAMSGQAKDIFISCLGRFDLDIAKAILMPSHIGGTTETRDQGSGGSLARSNVHFKMFMFVIGELQRQVSQIVNGQLIKQLCDLNFPNLKSYPAFVFNDVDDEVEVKIFELWDKLVTDKVVNRTEDDEKHIRSALGMPPNSEIKLEPLPADAALKSSEDLAKQGLAAKADQLDKQKQEPKPVAENELSAEMREYAAENNAMWVRVDGHAICVQIRDYMVAQEGDEWVVKDSSGRKVLGRHKTRDEALAQLRAIEASKAERQDHAYHPDQPRRPKGDARGGEWTNASDSEVEDAQSKLKKTGKGRDVKLAEVFGKNRTVSESVSGHWYDSVETASPFGPLAKGRGLWKEEDVNLADLKFSESAVNRNGVARMLEERADVKGVREPAYAIRDPKHGLILMDGHHRVTSAALLGRKSIRLRVVDGKKFDAFVQEMM